MPPLFDFSELATLEEKDEAMVIKLHTLSQEEKNALIDEMIQTDEYDVRQGSFDIEDITDENEPVKVFEEGLKIIKEKIKKPTIERFICVGDLEDWIQDARDNEMKRYNGVGWHWSWGGLDWRKSDFENSGEPLQLKDDVCEYILKLTASKYQHAIDVPTTIPMQVNDIWGENEVRLREKEKIFLNSIFVEDCFDCMEYIKVIPIQKEVYTKQHL